jgi:membrane-bound ClpP family serine protease
MAKRKTSIEKISNKTGREDRRKRAWKNVFLSLTLVPIVAGLFLIITWALDWDVMGALESQIWVGVLFLLLGFTFSNLIQQRWLLFCGWLFLAISDLIFLIWVNLTAQIVAGLIGIIGAGFLAYSFYQQIASQAEQQ